MLALVGLLAQAHCGAPPFATTLRSCPKAGLVGGHARWTPPQMLWARVGERLEQRLTGLCLTADGCDTPRDGGPAELEHCKRGCWAETRFNSLAQKWAVDTGSLENRREAVVNGSSKSLCLRVKNTSSVDIDLYEDSPSVFLGECLPAGAVGATQWTLIDHQRGMQGNSKYSLLRAEGEIDPDLCPDPPCCLTTAGMEKSAALHAMTAQIFVAMVLPLGAILGTSLAASGGGGAGDNPPTSESAALIIVSSLGAGALLFSLSVQVYAEMLQDLQDGSRAAQEAVAMVVCTVFGAAGYFALSLSVSEKHAQPLLLLRDTSSEIQAPLLNRDTQQEWSSNLESDAVIQLDATTASTEPEPEDSDDEGGADAYDHSPSSPRPATTALQRAHEAKQLAKFLWLSCWLDLLPQAVLFGLLAGALTYNR